MNRSSSPAHLDLPAEAPQDDEFYRVLLQDMPDMICRWRPDGTITFVNDRLCEYFACTPEELLGCSAMSMMPPGDVEQLQHLLNTLGPDKPFGTLEFEVISPDGTARWQEWMIRCLLDAAGNVTGFQSTGRDVTRRKRSDVTRLEEYRRHAAQRDVLNVIVESPALMTGDVDALACQVTELAAAAMGTARTNAWLFNEDETELRCIDLFEADSGQHSAGMVLKESQFANEFRALKLARYVDAHDPLTDPRTAGYVESYLKPLGITSMLDVVIQVSGRHKGLLCFEHVGQAHRWQADEIAFACQLADKLGLCIAHRERLGVTRELQEAQRVARMGNWQLNVASGTITWSDEVYRIFGRDPASFTPTLAIHAELMTPASLARLEAALAESQHSGTPYALDVEAVLPSGERRWVACVGEPVREPDGAISAVRGTAQDITARKHAEQALHLQTRALEAAANSIVITDRGGLIEWANPAFLVQAGYTLDEALGKRPADLLGSGQQDQAFYEQLWSTIQAGKVWDGQLVNQRRDGTLRTEDMTITPVTNLAGEITHFIAVKQDITDRLALEEQLHRAQRMESIGQLTGGIAHDFNNLLTVVMGNAELLNEALAGDARLAPMVEMITRGAQRGAELTHRLLAYARQQPLNPEVADLDSVVTGMQGLLRGTLGEHIEIEVACAPDLWPAMVDIAQLESALLNLAINARDAMPGGGKLVIEARNVELDDALAALEGNVQPGQYVQVSVSDSGCGISPENLSRAVEPFFTTKEKGKGTGLGLAMVYGFAKQSDGYLKLYSEPGEGTSVHLYLPRPTGDAKQARAVDGPVASDGGSELVLLVEDDELVRLYAEAQLAMLGYRVISAGDGPEALEVIRARDDIDLLFTDVVMPAGMNGRALAEAACALRPALKVLYTSGYTENAIMHHGRLDSGVHLLAKPYRRGELALKVRAALAETSAGI
jgi:PAS domain S-box-containing protein